MKWLFNWLWVGIVISWLGITAYAWITGAYLAACTGTAIAILQVCQ